MNTWTIRRARIPYHLNQPRIKIKGNRLMGRSGKVNPPILYKNELDHEKWTITQELYGKKLLGDQVWKLMKYKLKQWLR